MGDDGAHVLAAWFTWPVDACKKPVRHIFLFGIGPAPPLPGPTFPHTAHLKSCGEALIALIPSTFYLFSFSEQRSSVPNTRSYVLIDGREQDTIAASYTISGLEHVL